jgi:putative chitinase
MARIAPEWNEILNRCCVKPVTAAIWSEIFAACIRDDTFSKGDEELDCFLGQILEESAMLEHLEENLNYSAPRLMQVWPSRFPTLERAQACAHNPEALANQVYAKRLGNDERGDGWKYRGRGLVQVTGKSNYAAVCRATGIDCLNDPDLLAQPLYALQSAIAWWEGNSPDDVMGNVRKVTRLVNGGETGLAERTRLTDLAREALA